MKAGLVTHDIPITPEGKVMGEVIVKVKLTNVGDVYNARRGTLAPEEVRSIEVEAIVDSGAVCTTLPKSLAKKLGLKIARKQYARYANGKRELVGVSEPVRVELEGRSASDDALVLGQEVLIGQTVLEKTDLLVDCKRRRLVPGHPGGVVLNIR
jgi:clan AA aspartic protease